MALRALQRSSRSRKFFPTKVTSVSQCEFQLSSELIITFSELQIPPNANVYYAINTQHDLNFVLRPRGDITKDREKEAELFKGSSSTPGRKRDTSKARRKLLGLAL